MFLWFNFYIGELLHLLASFASFFLLFKPQNIRKLAMKLKASIDRHFVERKYLAPINSLNNLSLNSAGNSESIDFADETVRQAGEWRLNRCALFVLFRLKFWANFGKVSLQDIARKMLKTLKIEFDRLTFSTFALLNKSTRSLLHLQCILINENLQNCLEVWLVATFLVEKSSKVWKP